MVDILNAVYDLSDFEQHLLYERQLCKSTAKNYISEVSAFWRFSGLTSLSHATRDHIRFFLKYLEDRKMTKSGLSNHVTALRSYFNWLADTTKTPDIVELSMFLERIIKVKREKIIVFVPTKNDIDLLRQTLDAHKRAAIIIQDPGPVKRILREIAFIELLITSGLRSNELRSLRYCDVDLEQSTIDIKKGKGGHQRVSLFGGPAAQALREYFAVEHFHDEQRIFPYTQGNILNVIIKRWAVRARISPRIHAHSFRHYFITEAQRQGIRLEDVAQQVGHVNLNTTRAYTHQNIAFLKDRFRNCKI